VVEIAAASPELERGMISALGWIFDEGVVKVLATLVASAEPAVRRIGLAGHAVRRLDPGAQLGRLLRDNNERVRARAAKAAAELGRGDLLPTLLPFIRDADDDCRFYAAWAAARLGQRSEMVVGPLVDFASRPGQRQQQALSTAVRILNAMDAKSLLGRLYEDEMNHRVVTCGIGALGDPELMDALIQQMQVVELARVAGESFSMITGVDLSDANFERDRPEGFEGGPNDDPADENVAMDEDENLPWPDPERVANWWSAHRGDFQPGRRYLCGRPIEAEWCRQVLRTGYQRQRAAAALERALLRPAEPLFEVRARGSWQQQWLKT
jgi:uncharacterized protein (TIGR02270 family)